MAFAFVNSTSLRANAGIAASTWSLALANSSLVAGAGVVVGFNLASTVESVSTVTDNTTNVYKLILRSPGTKTRGGELWYCQNINEASTRLSVTLTGNSSG